MRNRDLDSMTLAELDAEIARCGRLAERYSRLSLVFAVIALIGFAVALIGVLLS